MDNLKNLLLEVDRVLSDAGGPGEFKYDGGPKPYIKKSGEVSETSKKRVEQYNEGTLPESQPRTVPVPTEEQQNQAQALVEKYYESKKFVAKYKALKRESSRLFNIYKSTPYAGNESNYLAAEKNWEDFVNSEEYQSHLKGMEAYNDAQQEIQRARLLAPLNSIQQGSIPEYEGSALSENSKDYLSAYKAPDTVGGSTFAKLNEYLANSDKKISKSEREFLDNASSALSEAIQGSTLKRDATVYRTVIQPSDFGGKSSKHVAELINLNKGDIFENKAFSSTTYNLESFKNMASSTPKGVKLVISLKKGSHGFNFDQDSELGNDDEYEVLLDKGSRFRVDGVDKKSRIIKTTLLDKDGPATDSIALDYTFIPEEHPRQKDPDWGGKPQEPSEAKPTVPFPTEEQQDQAQELVQKYYEFKGQDQPSKVSGLKGMLSKVSDFLGFGTEEMSPSRRNFLKKSVAMAAAQAMPSLPGGEMLKELTSFAGAGSKAILNPSESAMSKAYPVLTRELAKKFWGGFSAPSYEKRFGENYNPFMEDFESMQGEEAKSVTNAEELKEFIETQLSWMDESISHGAGEDRDYPHFLSQLKAKTPALNEILKLAGSDKDISHIINPKDMASYLWDHYKYQSRGTLPGSRPEFDEFGNALTEEGQIDSRLTGVLKELKESLPVPEELHELGHVGETWPEKIGDFIKAEQVQFEAQRASYRDSTESESETETEAEAESEIAEVESTTGLSPTSLISATSKIAEKIEEIENPYQEEHESPDLATDSIPFNSNLEFVIETSKGSIRRGQGFATRMPADYGYLIGFFGADGDEIDCYIGPNRMSNLIFVVDQNQIGSELFDEHKCFIGFASREEAIRTYYAGHHLGKEIFRGITTFSKREFLHWLNYGNLKKPLTQDKKIA